MPWQSAIRLAAVSLAACLALSVPASAQLTLLASVPGGGGGDLGYDPVHDAYFHVYSGAIVLSAPPRTVFVPATVGVFVNSVGTPVAPSFAVGPPGNWVRTAYSPDVSDGAGGHGGFLVVESTGDRVSAQLIVYPGRPVGSPATLPSSMGAQQVGVAYSTVDGLFLVAMEGPAPYPASFVRLDLSAQPIGSATLLSSEPGCPSVAFGSGLCGGVDVVWNSRTIEFGVLFDSHGKVLARIRGDGVLVGSTALSLQAAPASEWLYGAIDVNTSSGNYLVVGSADQTYQVGAAEGIETDGIGQIIARGIVTSSLDPAEAAALSADRAFTGLVALSYSPVSGTFLLAGGKIPSSGSPSGLLMELNPHGVALASPIEFGLGHPSFPEAAVSRTIAAEWSVANVNGTGLYVGTATRNGGSNARLAGCLIPDPFVSLGGGICANGGWVLPGMITAAPEGHSSAACAAPDPFASLGGGTCHDGGWWPPGMSDSSNSSGEPSTEPPPPSPPPTCTTPDPFSSIGGGVCVGGGWVPKGHPLAGGN
jgi:hypothetical protein